jgi:uncharacterized repeat protein (TIGR03833 family)
MDESFRKPSRKKRGRYFMKGEYRRDVKPGLTVDIVLKPDQRTGKRTRGIVKEILTSSPHHPHGIKVRLVSGQVGRVQEIIRHRHDALASDMEG